MLQQTQVDRVIERYQVFMKRFPTIESLAAADEQDVLAMWSGLGYYRQGPHLLAAARVVVEEHGGVVPMTPQSCARCRASVRIRRARLRRSSMGGRRRSSMATCSASSRVGTRTIDHPMTLTCADEPGRGPSNWSARGNDPATFNEGLMELGGLICRPRNPSCDECPVSSDCAARRAGLVDSIPPPKVAADRATVHYATAVVRRGDAILIEQRPVEGLWASMWQNADDRIGAAGERQRGARTVAVHASPL